jgi:HK97 family phage major capsid protein
MISNDDQSGTTTTTTGGEDGLRGLNSYPSGTTAAFGSNGSAMTDGLHTVATVTQAGASIAYNDIVALTSALPAQYWALPGTAFQMHPSTILALRELKDTSGMPLFLEIGDRDGASVGNVFGFPVIPNPYMDEIGTGNFSIYLANWDRFLTIADYPEMLIKRYDQTAPGFVTLYAEKRVLSTIRDVFAGVRLTK